ncbi:hypothetical protein [Streptomyces sp. CBMA123]|uniref:hypothetical protein n=1 Tax=Streptomyces sp. CBMA123 TaxID=1896313 RepID=UPI001E0F7C86|nr:hypothetical protein [Streptomyces sp. CBMA123]MBD0693576.1 hypothetical protein [Streptomyces sp. CBMA123]
MGGAQVGGDLDGRGVCGEQSGDMFLGRDQGEDVVRSGAGREGVEAGGCAGRGVERLDGVAVQHRRVAVGSGAHQFRYRSAVAQVGAAARRRRGSEWAGRNEDDGELERGQDRGVGAQLEVDGDQPRVVSVPPREASLGLDLATGGQRV